MKTIRDFIIEFSDLIFSHRQKKQKQIERVIFLCFTVFFIRYLIILFEAIISHQ